MMPHFQASASSLVSLKGVAWFTQSLNWHIQCYLIWHEIGSSEMDDVSRVEKMGTASGCSSGAWSIAVRSEGAAHGQLADLVFSYDCLLLDLLAGE